MRPSSFMQRDRRSGGCGYDARCDDAGADTGGNWQRVAVNDVEGITGRAWSDESAECHTRIEDANDARVFLTDAGQNYLPAVRNAFRQITEATRRVATAADTGILTVSVTPFFASAWLVPRLKDFQSAHPEIDLQVLSGKGLVDFSRDGVDATVRHGLGRYPGLVSEHLFAVEMVPVAAPALVERFFIPASAANLTRWPHVHDADRKEWHLWFQAQGIDDIGPPHGPAFDDSGVLLNAVLAGQGAGLVPVAMAALDLAEGRLVKLANVALPEAYAYYLIYPEANGERPKVAAFRRWILDAAIQGRTN
jgi:LysR family glycine cleavage system transcriptional activator